MPTLDRHDAVFVLDLGDGENRFHPDWMGSVNALLDEVEKADGPKALVTTASGKIWSNGLDLAWLMEHPEQFPAFTATVHKLFARVLSLPLVTVAALQGHTFAAGAMLSLCHDLRVMRSDRGFWCLPEADINIPFSVGMGALIQSRLTPQTAHLAMVTARRFGGTEAYAHQIVDEAVPEAELREKAIALAAAHASKAGPALQTIKTRMYASVLAALHAEAEGGADARLVIGS
ncbi:enoyl-CoA hydratase-related protein [Paractinoplanes durhamensis]|uniref:Enoyl-CoA hydratase n=1 Tax=Paractinoplanes durhamensis TaxID=113563 RepID=A0ABQ3ZDW5_9ACTN|nr:enoyl-CoA hydratase-related protein [Actinoplanes durhamensis]GIE08002.1 enoyl-CoA hydratase [Actinoplanes durhamensis]